MALDSIGSSQGTQSSVGAAQGGSSGNAFLDRLKQLATTDPQAFQKVAANVSSRVRTRAQSEAGTEATRLQQFADALDQAGKTGDISQVQQLSSQQPASGASGSQAGSQGGHGGHGHHHHHSGATP